MSQLLQHLRRIGGKAREDAPDAQLLARFLQQRDEAAFETLLRRHGPMVLGVCRRLLKNADDAEDAFQATFLVLVRKAATIAKRETVGGWLYGVAYKTALKARAANEQRRTKERRAAEMAQRKSLDEGRERELHELLDRELSRLPDKYRLPIVLCDLEGRTRKEAANQLGWPEGTLSGRLARGRALLAKRLTRHGLASGAVLPALSSDGMPAGVPHPLLASTVQAAKCLAGQAAVAGAIPVKVAALMDGVLKSMLLAKLKIAAASLLLVGVLGGGLLVPLAVSEPPTETTANSKARETEAAEPQTRKPQTLTDCHGDPLPPGALARLGTIRWRLPRFGVDQIVASADGKTLITVNALGGVSIWDSNTGKVIRQIPDASAARPEWSNNTRQMLERQAGAAQRVATLSADGHTAAFAAADGVIYLVDVPSGKVRQRCQGHRGTIQETALSSDGKILASRSEDGTLRIWDTSSGKQLRRLAVAMQQWVQYQPVHLALSPNGKTVAWVDPGKDRSIHIRDVASGEEKHRLLQHPGGERCIAFSPTGDVVLATCDKGPAQLWDARSGRLLRTLPHKGNSHPPAAAFTSDGATLVLAIQGDALCFHDVATGKELRRTKKYIWSSTEPDALAFSADGKTLFAKIAQPPAWVLHRYDTRTGAAMAAPEEARATFDAIVFAADDRIVHTVGGTWAMEGDKRLWMWDARTGAVVRQTTAAYPGGCRFSPDGRFLAFVDQEDAVCFRELATGKDRWRQRPSPGRRPFTLAFALDGSSLAISEWGKEPKSRHRIVVRNTANGAERGQIGDLDQPVENVHLAPDSRSLAYAAPAPSPRSYERLIYFRDLSTGRNLREPLRFRLSCPAPLAFSADGRTIAVPAEHRPAWLSVDFQEWTGWRNRLELPPFTGLPSPVAFSPDGLLFVMGDHDGAVRIFDAHTGRLLRRQEGHLATVTNLVFSHDGRKLVTVSVDTTALVWDITDLLRLAHGRQIEIPAAELRSLWEDLASADAAKGYRAIGRLARSGKQVLPWMRKHLHAVPAADPGRLAQLVADLDDDRFKVRDKAATELAELGELAVPALRKAMTGHPSLELRRRAESLLKQAEELSADKLRVSRSVEVVEMIGGTDAEVLLKEWAKGAAEVRLTREAKASLERLTQRHTPPSR